ncbi:MAG: dTMP kinase [Gammaproteobacteria bacterium]|nr:dTMP kinase [Gammaproteobacteria bacterium]
MSNTVAGLRTGRLITVEGIEGVGKSTNLAFVAGELQRAGHEVLLTREPGGTPLGERIRELLLHPDGEIVPMAELLLIFAARAAHIEKVILPALRSGRWVVCDRFTDASHAYQGGGRGIPAATIESLDQLVTGGLRPDLSLLLDVPLEVSAERQSSRGDRDRFEREANPFFSRVRARYLELAKAQPQRIRVIDAAQPLPEVQAGIRRALKDMLSMEIPGK